MLPNKTKIVHYLVPRQSGLGLLYIEKTYVPLHTVHIDCLDTLPIISQKCNTLMLIDSFNKYCNLIPLKSIKADEAKHYKFIFHVLVPQSYSLWMVVQIFTI